MRILHVFSGNTPLGIPIFVIDLGKQQALMGHDVMYFGIKGKGIKSYLLAAQRLRRYLQTHPCDVIHGHYIWSVFVAALQSKRFIRIGSFIGSDLYIKFSRRIARYVVTPLLDGIVVMNSVMAGFVGKKNNILVTPYGVDSVTFIPMCYSAFPIHPLVKKDEINILFSSRFDREEKNSQLANEACDVVNRKINLIEFKGLTRSEVVVLLNQVDLLLMTSLWEGSPQVVKEAMCCNCPVVSTNVGNVAWLLDGVDNSFICKPDPQIIAQAITLIAERGMRSNGRERIIALKLSQKEIASKILDYYVSVK